jgi:DNA-binding SARP family transcriptional activator
MPARLHLFGSPTMALDGAPLALPFERRSQLLVYLALKRGWVGRAELAAIFWPEQSQKLAFANLRKTLFRLQSVSWGRPIELQGQTARLEAPSDVAEFEAALRDGRIGDALHHYAGDLLAGFDDAGSVAWTSWLGFERERLRAAWRGAVLQRAAGEIDATEAVALTGRLLEADPLDEAALRVHLQALAQSGQGGRARQVYRAFVARLHEDLGLPPGTDLQALHDSLVGAPDAPRSPPVALAAEPVDDGFVGRSIERRRIAEMLGQGDCRLISLVGPGGVGKTRLAVEVAANLAGRVGSGSAFVDLAVIVDPDAIVPAMLHCVGIRADVGDPAAALRTLGELDVVVVLDNCEHLVDAVASVVETVTGAPGRARILATSRERLGVTDEQVWPVTPLDRLAARSLFLERARVAAAGSVSAEVDVVSVDRIVDAVDRLPLAIEMAAARLSSTGLDEFSEFRVE